MSGSHEGHGDFIQVSSGERATLLFILLLLAYALMQTLH